MPLTRFYTRLLPPFICVVALYSSAAFGLDGDDAAEWAKARAEAVKAYKHDVTPFVGKYCERCHGGAKQKGGFTFQSALRNPESSSSRKVWKRASAKIKTHDMPPDDEERQPSEE